MVCYTENKNFVGTLAKNKMYQFPESTVFENKSLIGKSFILLKRREEVSKRRKEQEEIKTLNNKGDNKNQNKSEKIRRVLENKPLNDVVIELI